METQGKEIRTYQQHKQIHTTIREDDPLTTLEQIELCLQQDLEFLRTIKGMILLGGTAYKEALSEVESKNAITVEKLGILRATVYLL